MPPTDNDHAYNCRAMKIIMKQTLAVLALTVLLAISPALTVPLSTL
ncbi:MAG: hypothetical protein J0665_02095 [Deltaproteobacteria bacterium]|nr:hypothetical protein [Deltaproteobacteria bacterium]